MAFGLAGAAAQLWDDVLQTRFPAQSINQRFDREHSVRSTGLACDTEMVVGDTAKLRHFRWVPRAALSVCWYPALLHDRHRYAYDRNLDAN